MEVGGIPLVFRRLRSRTPPAGEVKLLSNFNVASFKKIVDWLRDGSHSRAVAFFPRRTDTSKDVACHVLTLVGSLLLVLLVI